MATRGDFTFSRASRHCAAKAIAAGAVSGAAGYRVKKGLDVAMRKKRVGKISAAQAAANQRLVRNMRRRWFKIGGVK